MIVIMKFKIKKIKILKDKEVIKEIEELHIKNKILTIIYELIGLEE